jgi:hypothetical protein
MRASVTAYLGTLKFAFLSFSLLATIDYSTYKGGLARNCFLKMLSVYL